MTTLKTLSGFAALLLGLTPFIPYLRDVFKRKTTPHLYSWLVWSILQTTGVVAMLVGGAGIGALALSAGSFFVVFVFFLSFKYGTKNITIFDTICLIGALGAIVIWLLERNPLYSIILVTLIDFTAFLPTYRKSYVEPRSETSNSYIMWAASDVFGLLALATYSPITVIYIASLVITNSLCVLFLYLGTRKLRKQTTEAPVN